MKTLLTKEEILKFLPERTSLIYVDYRDSLDEHHDLIQECIHKGNFDALYESIDEWYRDAEWDGITEYINEIRTAIENHFDLTEFDAEEITDEYEDEIREAIYDRCDDNLLKDLLRNTSDPIAHYDTDYYMESGSWNWSDAEVRLERMKIKKFLQVKNSDHDHNIDMMIRQASYGGYLLIYFKMKVDDFINYENSEEQIKSIKFRNAHIGIIDHNEGSGDVTELKGHEFILPYNRENVFLEQTIKYNWTYSIAGMVRDWCDSTVYEFSTRDVGEIEISSTNAHLKREEEYNETYRKGKCTAGDMDISRHRNVEYINNFPCGNKCKDCGTFWVD